MVSKAEVRSDDTTHEQFLPFIVLGFAFCWAVTYIFAYSFLFTPTDIFSPLQRDVGIVCYLCGIVIAEVALYASANRLGQYHFRRSLAVGACIGLLLMISLCSIGSSMGLDVWVRVCLMLVPGMWQGVSHILWAESFMYLRQKKSWAYVGLSVVIGAAIFIFTTLIAGNSGMVVVAFLAFLSLVCYVLARQFRPNKSLGKTGISRKLSKALYKSNVVLVIYGAIFGVGIYACMVPGIPSYISYTLTGVALGLGVAILLLINIKTNRIFSFNELTLALLPILAVALLLLTFVSGTTQWLLYLLLLMVLTTFDASSFCFLFELTERLHLDPIRSLARGRIYIQSGMFLSGLVNLFFVNFFDVSKNYSFCIPLILVVFLFVMVVVSGTIDAFPEHYLADGCRKKDDFTEQGGTADAIKRRKLSKCRKLAEEYDLSDRELDVLAQLMKGYNAGSIAGILYISQNTVKTHIYHIYKKMGVNSKREVIEKLDSL